MARDKLFIGVNQFTGDYKFLSNFYPMGGKTLEHYYQAKKTRIREEKESIMNCKTPGQAKRLGRKITLRTDWEEKKIAFMTKLVRKKFKDKKLAKMLIATDTLELTEGNDWHDNFWGNCYCEKCYNIKGQNHLGKIF